MQGDIEKVLIDRHAIAQRIDQLATQIIEDLEAPASPPETAAATDSGPAIHTGNGISEITLVPILTGSIIFVSDLIRRLPLRMQISLISVTSYPGTATASRGASVQASLTSLPESLEGRHVLIIDDILDSGGTLRLVTGLIRRRNPASVRTCVLLRKQRPEAMDTPVDYIAFDIPDAFVVGYGLDYDDYYRNLPDIVTLRREVYSGG